MKGSGGRGGEAAAVAHGAEEEGNLRIIVAKPRPFAGGLIFRWSS
jgi:hypothetical protein